MNTSKSPEAHACLRSSAWLFACLMILSGVSGCQKRCQSMDLGVVKLGMQYSYTPGPVELLEESRYHRKGPDFPQQSIPERIRKGVLRRFALQSNAAPLVEWLENQHFTCAKGLASTACHLSVKTSLEERCELFEPTQHYLFEETIDIEIQEHDTRIEAIKVDYGLKEIYKGK
ncbi:hypothetical protein [Aquabacterium sp.]|uniref:hypothetical protein n=1 Tax=Aquabacterium sp. TaxID=1872578 RepID=UPI0024880911|nr:hypothetical protein [Aquabacterium sp.]MDI1258126.1 hypothetical protein [Aquabacterium sp.]